MPTVCFFGCSTRFGTSFVAGRMKVYGPGVQALTARNTLVLMRANWLAWLMSRHTSVKLWRWSSPRMSRIRSRASACPIRQPRA